MAQSMLVCVSHSPIIMIRAKAPEREAEILRLYEKCVAEIAAFDPELVVIFGSDHYAGFHLEMMPPYCVGLAAKAVDDVGGFEGQLNVASQEALQLTEAMQNVGFDLAVSRGMTVDHAFSQPVHRLLGGLDARPLIPVFVNAIAPPLPAFSRTRRLGAAVGRYLMQQNKRTLYIGSGGLSHHPTRYYPLTDAASSDVLAWQMHAERGGSMSQSEWLDRLYTMHVEGATMLVDGRRTSADIRLNPEFDDIFMSMTKSLDFTRTDQWKTTDIVEKAGIGAMELLAWAAAGEAYKAVDGRLPHAAIYAPALEYGIGYGMVFGGGR